MSEDTPYEDMSDLITRQKKERSEKRRELLDYELIKPKMYATLKEADEAYKHVLETGERASAAIQKVAELEDKDSKWIDEVKHNPVHKTIKNAVMQQNADHPVIIHMINSGLYNPTTKRGIKEAPTFSSFLNSVANMMYLLERMARYEQAAKVISDRVDDHDNRLEAIEKLLTGPKEQLKMRARMLYQSRWPKTAIAKELGKDVKTIRNWLKDMEE